MQFTMQTRMALVRDNNPPASQLVRQTDSTHARAHTHRDTRLAQLGVGVTANQLAPSRYEQQDMPVVRTISRVGSRRGRERVVGAGLVKVNSQKMILQSNRPAVASSQAQPTVQAQHLTRCVMLQEASGCMQVMLQCVQTLQREQHHQSTPL